MSALPLALRLAEERRFHDEQAQARWRDLGADPDRLRLDAGAYLAHEPWIAPALGLVGDVAGRRVLDFGCGHGMAGVFLAQRGAQVTAFDLSAGYVKEAQARAAASGVDQSFRAAQAAGEHLPFAAGAFDRIWGHAILHHLDLPRAAAEIRRVLAPGGWAVFCEPWGGNPLLEGARRWLPYPGKHRSRDERPLRPADLALLRRRFRDVAAYPFQLLGMAKRLAPGSRLWRWADRADAALFRRFPALRPWCRYVVLTLQA